VNPIALFRALTPVAPHDGLESTPRQRWTETLSYRRAAIVAAATLMGGGLAYGASWILYIATACNGGCPTANAPWPFVIVIAAVSGWSALSGSKG